MRLPQKERGFMVGGKTQGTLPRNRGWTTKDQSGGSEKRKGKACKLGGVSTSKNLGEGDFSLEYHSGTVHPGEKNRSDVSKRTSDTEREPPAQKVALRRQSVEDQGAASDEQLDTKKRARGKESVREEPFLSSR